MIDVSSYSKASDELRGINEKLWLDIDGRLALFKKTQIREDGTHTNAHFAEKLVSILCKCLDFPCADIDIAMRNNEIGCVSYSFLSEGDELIDFIALIQSIRQDFNSKRFITKKTKEPYGVPLMIEALEKICGNEKDLDTTRKHMLQSLLVDSIIEHYDRNPSNIAVIRNGSNIRFSPMFDNGTSLGVSLPDNAVDYYLESEERLDEHRERVLSKVGTDDRKCMHYDILIDYILCNHYSDVSDFISSISERLTPENIRQLLSNSEFDDLDEKHKTLIRAKLERNVQKLVERAKAYERKNIIEQAMQSPDAVEALNALSRSGTLVSIIPEFEACIGCEQKNDFHVLTVDQYIFKCIDGINRMSELMDDSQIGLAPISERDKQLLRWTMIFHDIGKPRVKKERLDKKTGQLKDTFYSHAEASLEIAKPIMEDLGFSDNDMKKMQKLIAYHDRIELKSDKAVRRFIFGENGLGEENINLFVAIRLAEAEARNPEKKEQCLADVRQFISIADRVIEEEKDLIKRLPITGKKIKNMGIDGIDINSVQKNLANAVMENPDISKNDLMCMAQKLAKDIRLKRKKEREETIRYDSKRAPGASFDIQNDVFSDKQIAEATRQGKSSQDIANAEKLQKIVGFNKELTSIITSLENRDVESGEVDDDKK